MYVIALKQFSYVLAVTTSVYKWREIIIAHTYAGRKAIKRDITSLVYGKLMSTIKNNICYFVLSFFFFGTHTFVYQEGDGMNEVDTPQLQISCNVSGSICTIYFA